MRIIVPLNRTVNTFIKKKLTKCKIHGYNETGGGYVMTNRETFKQNLIELIARSGRNQQDLADYLKVRSQNIKTL